MNKYIEYGEKFLVDCVFNGLAHSYSVGEHKWVKPYPEVTGYVIKYFCDYYDDIPENIYEASEFLMSVQEKNGGYASFEAENILYVFDTSIITRGLCALYKKKPNTQLLESIIKGAEFIVESQESNGLLKPIYNRDSDAWIIWDKTYSIWGGPYSGLMCKVVECLLDVYELSKDAKYLDTLNLMKNCYSSSVYIDHSHPLGYWLEGLFACRELDLVDNILKKRVKPRLSSNGYISYTDEVDYAYVSGAIQLGIIMYKMGYYDEAKSIRDYGRLVQDHHECGGLFQYANQNGELVSVVHDEINSWGTKYFLELERLLED